MKKINCPECGSQKVMFSKDFICTRFWFQVPNEPTYFYNYELGDTFEERAGCKIIASCQKCKHLWELEGSVDTYLE